MAALGLAGLPVAFQQPQQQPQPQQHQQQQQQSRPVQPLPPPPPTPLDPTAITIKLATLAGEKFKDVFYDVFDCHRTDLFRFFTPHSLLLWEGIPVSGMDQCRQMFEMLPPSKHAIHTFDVQPITGGEFRGVLSGLLVTVTGIVTWGSSSSSSSSSSDSSPASFYHSFVIERAVGAQVGTKHYIASATIRTRFTDEVESGRPARKRGYHRRD